MDQGGGGVGGVGVPKYPGYKFEERVKKDGNHRLRTGEKPTKCDKETTKWPRLGGEVGGETSEGREGRDTKGTKERQREGTGEGCGVGKGRGAHTNKLSSKARTYWDGEMLT